MAKLSNTAEFIEKATIVHGDRYDYSQFIYTHSSVKSIIICRIHGEFTQTPNKHLIGHGCAKCYTKPKKYDTLAFIEKANEVHNGKYVYTDTVYVDNYTKVTVQCTEHGYFEQLPSNHLRYGCKECAIDTHSFGSRLYEEHGNNLYLIEIPHLNVWKIGVTKFDIKHRFGSDNIDMSVVFISEIRYAYMIEMYIKKCHSSIRYTGEPLLKSGNTELFIGTVPQELLALCEGLTLPL